MLLRIAYNRCEQPLELGRHSPDSARFEQGSVVLHSAAQTAINFTDQQRQIELRCVVLDLDSSLFQSRQRQLIQCCFFPTEHHLEQRVVTKITRQLELIY